MKCDLLLKNISGKNKKYSIGLDNDIIARIGNIRDDESENIIDCSGLYALPGLIDSHVHMREPGQEYKEDFVTGSRAAIAGGVTAVIDMPNNKEPIVTLGRLKKKIELAKKAICKVYFHFGTDEKNFEEVKLAEKLVRGLKIYMNNTTGGMIINDPTIIEKHFRNFDSEKPVVVHAEGGTTKTAAEIAKKTGRRIHLAHGSTKEEVELIKNLKNGTVEVTPHHLLLKKEDQEKFGRVKPPLRSEIDRKGLWTVLDKVDCVATDHAPHTVEEKKEGAFGFTGLETSLALMLDQYNRGNLSLDWIEERMAINPARIFGLEKQGEIKAGYRANITLVDLKEEWTVEQEELETKCKFSPFDRWKLKGRVKKVILNGKMIYNCGEFL